MNIDTTARRGTVRIVVAAAFGIFSLASQAVTFSVAHTFTGPDGSTPMGDLGLDAAGNLYGTASAGGSHNFGTLYKYDGVTLTTLYDFSGGADGGTPQGGVLADNEGNLYGTTKVGGTFGTVFRWDREAVPHLRTLKSFNDKAADGIWPSGGLTRDADGTLYGTTFEGGNLNCATVGTGCGSIFKISPSGVFAQIYRFNGSMGYAPNATLRRVKDRLYGTTVFWGPYIAGSPFSVKTDGSAFSAIMPDGVSYNFVAGLTADTAGNLWGVALRAGTTSMGGIYKIDTTGVYHLVHTFSGNDGAYPTGTMAIDAKGVLYGTTEGALVWGSEGYGPAGYGTVFQFDTRTGVLTTLHQFTGPDGKNPVAGVIRDPSGDLYGVTAFGGPADKGVLFRVTP